MRSWKSLILSTIFKFVNFICYGDLPTSFYLKRGMKVGCNFHRQSATKFDPSHCFLIKIGDDVTIANYVQILAHDDTPRVYTGYGKVGKVVIGNHVFIGAKSLILPNVVIGDNVIIGAGSVVTKNIPSNSVAVGIPAKVMETTENYIEKCSKEINMKSKFNKQYICDKKLDYKKKNKILQACQTDYAYIELGKVIEYGRKKYE